MSAGLYRRVKMAVWTEKAFRALTDDGRTLYLRLLTGPETSPIRGVLVTGPEALAEAMTWKPRRLGAAFAELLAAGMAQADWPERLVWFPEALRHHGPDNPKQVMGWRDYWALVPDCDLRRTVYLALRTAVEARGFLEAFEQAIPSPIPYPNGSGNGSPTVLRTVVDIGSGSGSGSGGGEGSSPPWRSGHAWKESYGLRWRDGRYQRHYGNGSDGKAIRDLEDNVLSGIPEAELVALWERRDEFFDAFLSCTDDRLVKGKHAFALFTARFSDFRPDLQPQRKAAQPATRPLHDLDASAGLPR